MLRSSRLNPSRLLVLLATGALLTTGLAGCGDSTSDASARPTSPTSPISPTGPGSSGGSRGTVSPTTTQRPGTVAVPVYYVGDTPQEPRLFREFRRVPTGDRLLAAARLLAGTAQDPDYRTPFPAGGGFDSVARSTTQIKVALADPAWLTRGSMTRKQARLAVQALVYTLQGASQQRLPVLVYVPGEGAPAPTLFGVPMKQGFHAAKPLTVLAFVSVTSPEQGAQVTRTLAASGVASSFEGTVPWTIHRGGATGAVVRHGSAQAAGAFDRLYPWSTSIDLSRLAPGAYTFVATTDDPSEGEGGGPTTDSKAFTLR